MKALIQREAQQGRQGAAARPEGASQHLALTSASDCLFP